MTYGSLMKGESIAECSPWSILQYFWPALSDNRSWKSILVFSFSGYLGKVLLYCYRLFDLILDVPSTIFQLNRDGSSWVEPVLS